MGISQKKWGYLEWIDENLDRGVNVGLVVMNPGSHHAPHKHYDEQIIYVLQGQALSIVDGVEESISPGTSFHWQVGVTHEVYNIGNVPFTHLLVSIPSDFQQKDQVGFQPFGSGNGSLQLNEIIDQLRGQLLDHVNFPYGIFDDQGRYILGGQTCSSYCEKMCCRSEMQEFCSCMMTQNPQKFQQECEFTCIHNLNIINVPIFLNKEFLGYVQGGYYWSSSHGGEGTEELYDVPESTELMMHNFLHQIRQIIVSYCGYELNRRQFNQKMEELEVSRHSQDALMKELKQAEYQVTDLKINHHFLFNTLNSMSAMAIRSGSMELYQSIVDLSKMFRYTLRTQNPMVSLNLEMSYVNAYLNLQKIRYKNNLSYTSEIEQDTLGIEVPFNILQPIVENAFVHGFHDLADKKIHIRSRCISDYLQIEILNSGKRMTEEEIELVNCKIRGGTAHGMAMVYDKLRNLCGPGACLDMIAEDDNFTCLRFTIPVKEC